MSGLSFTLVVDGKVVETVRIDPGNVDEIARVAVRHGERVGAARSDGRDGYVEVVDPDDGRVVARLFGDVTEVRPDYAHTSPDDVPTIELLDD